MTYSSQDSIIGIENVSKAFGKSGNVAGFVAVDGLNLKVPEGQMLALSGTASMAGLPCCKAMVCVGPPLLARGPSLGSVFCTLPVPLKPQLLSLDRL